MPPQVAPKSKISEWAHVTFAALTLNPSPKGRGTSDLAPLLPREKGLGDEGNLQT